MTVGEEIRRRREDKGWSQAKLGVLSGAGPSGISQIETGRRNPSAGTLQRIADALEVEVRDLFPLGQVPLPDLEAISEPRERSAADGNLAIRRRWEDLEENLTTEQVREILEGVRDGRIAVEVAVHRLEKAGKRPA